MRVPGWMRRRDWLWRTSDSLSSTFPPPVISPWCRLPVVWCWYSTVKFTTMRGCARRCDHHSPSSTDGDDSPSPQLHGKCADMARTLRHRDPAGRFRGLGYRGDLATMRGHVRPGALGSAEGAAHPGAGPVGRETPVLWSAGPVLPVRFRIEGPDGAPGLQGGSGSLRAGRTDAPWLYSCAVQYLHRDKKAAAGALPLLAARRVAICGENRFPTGRSPILLPPA